MIFSVKVIKFLLFTFNFVFAIFGIAILSLGVVYKLQIETIVHYLGKDFPIAPDLFIAIGSVAFIISFLGCIGASRQNRPMLIAFVVLLVILLVIELAVVIIAFVDITNGQLDKHIEDIITQEAEKGKLGRVESKLECCGVKGPETNQTNPESCYKDGIKDSDHLFDTGCLEKIRSVFHSIGLQLGAIAIAVAIIEIIGSLFALTLSSSIINETV